MVDGLNCRRPRLGTQAAVAEPARYADSRMALPQKDFEAIRELAYRKFGLDLQEGKEELVAARLSKKLREHRLESFGDYYRHVLEDSTGEALIGLIDALTTNHTCFLREPAHFEYLRDVIVPSLGKQRRI